MPPLGLEWCGLDLNRGAGTCRKEGSLPAAGEDSVVARAYLAQERQSCRRHAMTRSRTKALSEQGL